MIPAAALRSLIRVFALSFSREMSRDIARRELRNLKETTFSVKGSKFVSRRFKRLDKKVQRKIRWNALRDASNHYRNKVRAAWKAMPVKNPTNKYRKAVARSYQIKRGSSNSLYVGASYKSSPRARIAHLLEWGHRGKVRAAGRLIGTTTLESESDEMLKLIAESVRYQVEHGPENAKARRQSIRARLET